MKDATTEALLKQLDLIEASIRRGSKVVARAQTEGLHHMLTESLTSKRA